MTGLRPLSDTLVTTLIGVTGFYKLSIDNMGKNGEFYRYPPSSLRRLNDYGECTIEIYDSNKKYLGFIYWNNWNEGDERVSDYSTYFDEHWGEFGDTATSDFESIGDLCRDWHEKWREL